LVSLGDVENCSEFILLFLQGIGKLTSSISSNPVNSENFKSILNIILDVLQTPYINDFSKSCMEKISENISDKNNPLSILNYFYDASFYFSSSINNSNNNNSDDVLYVVKKTILNRMIDFDIDLTRVCEKVSENQTFISIFI
jgi:hypothetical protein